MAYLDPVVATFIARAAGFIGPVETMAKVADNAREAVDKLNASIALLSGKDIKISASVSGISGPIKGAIAQVTALKAAMAGLGGATVKIGADMQGAGRAAVATAGWFRLTGNAIHWIVMGTLEVAATAIPALVALGAAAIGMYPTFSGIYDRMNALVIASGGLSGALQNSVGPLRALSQGMGGLTAKMAPDAYVIFGSVINDLTGKFGIFSHVAQQAGVVLAGFATRITQDLQGPLGNQLAKFFANSVKYMVQWGQVLGNLGHTFVNVMHAMPGAAQLLLDVLVAITRALVAISSSGIGAALLGIAAGFSAAYRYALLLVKIFNWLGGSALVTGIKNLYSAVRGLAIVFGLAGGGAAGLKAVFLGLLDMIGPVGLALAALGIALGIWYLNTRRAADATTTLISKLAAVDPTVTNLSNNIRTLSNHFTAFGSAVNEARLAIGGLSFLHQVQDIFNLGNAIIKTTMELLNLRIGLAQMRAGSGAVAAGMQAIAVQTALADSKVAQLNQALDQFMQLVTGGTGGLAAFVQSLQNIGTVAGHVRNNLGQATGQMSLSVRQFASALSQQLTAKGAGAWTNFDQILGSTMPQMMDWFRQASTLGAATGHSVTMAALDMASAMTKYAGSNRTAQATILAFVRAQGINVRSWPALLQAFRSGGASLKDLKSRTDAATIAMSHLSQMAKNTAAVLNSQITASLAAASLKATNFQTYITNAANAMAHGGIYGGKTWQQWMTLASGASSTATRNALALAGQMTSTGNAAGPAGSRIAAGFDHARISAWNAQQAASSLQGFINGMHGTTLAIHVNQIMAGLSGLTGGLSAGTAGGGTGSSFGASAVRHGANITVVNVTQHVAGSVIAEQQLGRLAVQAVNRQSFRNPSNQLALKGRGH